MKIEKFNMLIEDSPEGYKSMPSSYELLQWACYPLNISKGEVWSYVKLILSIDNIVIDVIEQKWLHANGSLPDINLAVFHAKLQSLDYGYDDFEEAYCDYSGEGGHTDLKLIEIELRLTMTPVEVGGYDGKI